MSRVIEQQTLGVRVLRNTKPNMDENDNKDLYSLPTGQKMLTEDDVRIIVSQQLRSIIYPTVVTSGFLQSGNFVSGVSGWKLSPTGIEAANFGVADVQEFAISGTWTKPSGGTIAFIQCWGGGGGGGCGGGGGGGYNEDWILLSTLGTTETVTVGTGGAGAAQDASAGGNTSFGAHVLAYGGGGGGGTSTVQGGG